MTGILDDDADVEELRAEAAEAARHAPPADPNTAREAIRDAQGVGRENESHVNPVYKTQGKAAGDDHVTGENVHRDTDAIISEFDKPAENTV